MPNTPAKEMPNDLPARGSKASKTASKPSERGARHYADIKAAPDVATPEGRLNEAPLLGMLGYQLAQASVVTVGNYQELVGNPYGLRAAEYTMLALIDANPGVSPAQLAKALSLSAPYVTAGLDKLCQKAWVVREVSTKDGRKQHVSTTEQGKAVATELTNTVLESERARFKNLTQAEKMMLAELLRKLAHCRTLIGL